MITVSSTAGARPVLIDIDPDRYTLDPGWIPDAITPRTRAVLSFHLYGQPTEMDPILDLAYRHGLPVIEDYAQEHGASYRGKRPESGGGSPRSAPRMKFEPIKPAPPVTIIDERISPAAQSLLHDSNGPRPTLFQLRRTARPQEYISMCFLSFYGEALPETLLTFLKAHLIF